MTRTHPAIGTLCPWNGRLAIWWPGTLGEWSSWLMRAWSSASPTVALSDGPLLLWVSHPAASLLCRHIPLRGPHLCLLCGHAAVALGVIVASYAWVLTAVINMTSTEGKQKALTAASFTQLWCPYPGGAIFRYMQKASARTSVGERATFIFYTIQPTYLQTE